MEIYGTAYAKLEKIEWDVLRVLFVAQTVEMIQYGPSSIFEDRTQQWKGLQSFLCYIWYD